MPLDVWIEDSRRLMAFALRMRFRIVGMPVAFALFFGVVEGWTLRPLAFLAVASGLFLMTWFEERLARTRPITPRRFRAHLFASAGLQAVVVAAAGGLAGPLFPGLVLLGVITTLFLPTGISSGLVFGVQLPIVWLLAALQSTGAVPGLVPEIYAGLFEPAGSAGPGPWIAATVYTGLAVGTHVFARSLRRTYQELVDRGRAERNRVLELHREQTRTLSALSAEIAHELKNPLSSIKGLASLLRRDLDGVAAERMDVLRREVDRMQGILEEFLNYSRPLVPLEATRVDLGAIVREVVLLHEGVTRPRGLKVEVSGAPGEVSCDPRKVRQILLNVLQNAIEASPDGATIAVDLGGSPERVTLTVTDHGPGLSPELAGRLFSVGATTKPSGSGIGLAVARGLARQHGGELSLASVDGGARAVLELPR